MALLRNRPLRSNRFSRQEIFFFKNLDSKNKCKNESDDNNGKYGVDLGIQFQKIRFFALWSSQRPPGRVGAKFFKFQVILKKKNKVKI